MHWNCNWITCGCNCRNSILDNWIKVIEE
jgi:hypothetical protein